MKAKIEDVVSENLITVKLTCPLDEAYRILKKNHFRHLPVVDEKNHIVGILSDRDFKKAMITYDSGHFEFNPDDNLNKYMSQSLKVVPADAPLTAVVQIMLDEQISSVLISKKGVISGIVTTEDILSIFLKVNQSDHSTFFDSALNWIYRKPIDEIAFQLAQIGL
jgi:acetoin utilization protein AcuB